MAAVAILGLSIGFGPASATGTKTPVRATTAPGPAVRIAAGPNCTMEQGHCEDKCVRASGGNASQNKCFHQCQAEKDACDASQH